MKHALGGRGSNESSTTRSWDEFDKDGGGLALHLGRHSVRFTELVAPVATANGHRRELSEDDGSADSGSDFLGAFDTETKVTVKVTDGHKGLEAGTLTGTGLLLDRHDLHDLVYGIV